MVVLIIEMSSRFPTSAASGGMTEIGKKTSPYEGQLATQAPVTVTLLTVPSASRQRRYSRQMLRTSVVPKTSTDAERLALSKSDPLSPSLHGGGGASSSGTPT